MSRPSDPDDLGALDERFAEDLRTAFPPTAVPDPVVEAHVAAMMAATPEPGVAPEVGLEWAERAPSAPLGSTTRRRSMSERMVRRALAVVGAIVLSLGGLAIAGAFSGSGDQGDDDQAVVVDAPEDDQGDVADAADENEDVDQNEDADENEEADENEDLDENEDVDENEDADDPGEDADDQGEDADDAAVADDDQGEDGDHQGENEGDDAGQNEGDDAGQDDSNDDGANAGDDQGGAEDGNGGDSQD